MLRLILVLTALAATAVPAAAESAVEKCRAIKDDANERLKCFDAIEQAPAAAPAAPKQESKPGTKSEPKPATRSEAKAAAGDDGMIARAKEAVKAELRIPESATFSNVKLRTVDGKPAVCGYVSAASAANFYLAGQPFAYDGDQAYLLLYGPGLGSISKMSTKELNDVKDIRVKAYKRLCK
jgi:hypothetical protein